MIRLIIYGRVMTVAQLLDSRDCVMHRSVRLAMSRQDDWARVMLKGSVVHLTHLLFRESILLHRNDPSARPSTEFEGEKNTGRGVLSCRNNKG